MTTIRDLQVSSIHTDGRRIAFAHPYARGWIEVDATGTITASEIDTTFVAPGDDKPRSLTDRAGAAVAKAAPKLHALYVGASSAVADALGADDKVYRRIIALCEMSGTGGDPCEKLKHVAGRPFCEACGCAHNIKRAAGLLAECPIGRCKLEKE